MPEIDFGFWRFELTVVFNYLLNIEPNDWNWAKCLKLISGFGDLDRRLNRRASKKDQRCICCQTAVLKVALSHHLTSDLLFKLFFNSNICYSVTLIKKRFGCHFKKYSTIALDIICGLGHYMWPLTTKPQ